MKEFKLLALPACGASCGLVVGGVASLAFVSPTCPAFDPAFLGGGTLLGAGPGAVLALGDRPDPASFNREDPPPAKQEPREA